MGNWVDELISEYKQGRKGLSGMKNKLGESLTDEQDKSQINSMIDTMTEAIEWMSKGREPGNLRGIDKHSAYHRRVIVDMDLFPSLEIEKGQEPLTEKEKQAIVEILVDLSPRERQCYLLNMAYDLSLSEISTELNIGKSTVQKYLERAKHKVSCRTNVVRTPPMDEGTF